ncbi:hypothetical protein [Nitrobacter sp. JJSN]|uniref:hypothetical protein n=1 Tax=Nitrobacter sp. JJSN TaxID=3453033 RepID=UPI003F774D76
MTPEDEEATLKDAANTIVGVYEAVRELKKLGATVDQIAKALAETSQTPNAIREGLETCGFPANLIAPAMQAAFPGIPHADTFVARPHADVAVPHTDVAPVHQDVAPIHADVRDVDGKHSDVFTTPHVDVYAPHLDTGRIEHVELPPPVHVDTP